MGSEREWIYTRIAHYHETDQMGVVHHSNYIKWMEEARVYIMDKIGYSYKAMEDRGLISPVLNVTCDYHKSVHFDDKIRIKVYLKKHSKVRFTLSYEMYNDSKMASCTSERRRTASLIVPA